MSENKIDFCYMVEVVNGNPNGDPDMENSPRVDPETGRGLLSDVSVKRRLRDAVLDLKEKAPGYDILVEPGVAINPKAIQSDNIDRDMCEAFYDVRTFGAVLSTKEIKGGQIRGPIQITFAQSVDPINPLLQTITRCTDLNSTSTQIGSKWIVPYGLYVGYGFYSPLMAKKTGFAEEDLSLFWQAFQYAYEGYRTSSKGLMSLRGLYVFEHGSKYGSVPSHTLFDRIHLEKKVETPRSFSDYHLSIDEEGLDKVTLRRLV